MDFRELADIRRHSELTACCMASLSGNSGFDAKKSADNVMNLLDRSYYQRFPYDIRFKKEATKKPARKDYSEYFKILKEKERKRQEELKKKGLQQGDEGTSTGKE